MRKNKKLLLASVAAMGALALGVGATSTFAWFEAEHFAKATVSTVGSKSGIETANQAEIAALNLKIKVTITAPTAVELTNASDSGKTYVMHGGSPVEASNQTSLVKNGIGTFTIPEGNAWASACAVTKSDDSELAESDVTNFNANKTFTVKLQATNKVRIGVDVENKTASARTTNSYVGTYTASSDILLGTATITLAWDNSANKAYVDGVVYAADSGNKAGATASAINYYYSISPENTDAVESNAYAYGTVTATLTAA